MENRLIWIIPGVIAGVTMAQSTAFSSQYLTVDQAQKVCFPEASNWTETVVKMSSQQKSEIQSKSGIDVRSDSQLVYKAFSKSRQFVGWLIIDDVIGKHDYIHWALALNPNGTVRQIEILSYREAYGSEIRDQTWRAQFVGKSSASPLRLDRDIRNISGATLSSRHIVDGVNRLLSFYEVALKP